MGSSEWRCGTRVGRDCGVDRTDRERENANPERTQKMEAI